MPPPHPALVAFAREFNASRYFEAHEVLEEALEVLPEELWDLFVGLIQIAVGYHKRSQGLRRGSTAMLRRGLEKMRPFPDDAAGIDLAPLRARVAADIQHAETPDAGGDAESPDSRPRIRFRRPVRPDR